METNAKPVANAAGCYDVDWASWVSFTGRSATGTIVSNGETINVTMTSNFNFSSTPAIYNHSKFNNYPSPIPNATVPQTTWLAGPGGVTTMCFSKTVTNPVLLIASLGASSGITVDLNFSLPYVVLYDGGNMQFTSSTSLKGTEGYAIIMFPGEFNCVTVNSNVYEFYTNITWGIRPPPFQVNVNEVANTCTGVTLEATGGVSYSWNGGDTPNSATNTFRQSGTYLLTVTNALGCVTSVSRAITVNAAPPATITGNTTGCDSVQLTASGGTAYLWSGGDTPNGAVNTFRNSGTYSVTISNGGGCGSTVLTKSVIVNTPVAATISTNVTGCGSVQLTAGGGDSYQWNGGDTPNSAINTFRQSGTYSVTISNAAGCSETISRIVTVHPAPVVNIAGATNGCSSVQLTASGGTTYLWSGGDTPTQATNTFRNSGSYTVQATGPGGCVTSASVQVTVSQPVVPQISIMASMPEICEGEAMTFTASIVNGGSAPAVEWYLNNILAGTGLTYIATGLKDQDEIKSRLINSDFCAVPAIAESNSIRATVNPLPALTFDKEIFITDQYPVRLEPVINGDVAVYEWTPARGLDNPNIRNPMANPDLSTVYRLKITTLAGCESTADLTVTVARDIIIPNTFTPNADGVNDLWNISNLKAFPDARIRIFNRHGELLFESAGYENPWNGMYRGKDLAVGSYFYVIDLNNGTKLRKGTVTLLR